MEAGQLDKDGKKAVNVKGLRPSEKIGVHWKNSHGLYHIYSEKHLAACLNPTEVDI